MRCLIIGFGSIGQRHARLLIQLGCEVAVVTKREVGFLKTYLTLSEALEKEKPGYVIIANQTADHFHTLMELVELEYNGVLLIEKPLFHELKQIPKHSFQNVFVAYQLRFHPLIQRLREILESEQILSIQAYVGQYLPTWRPQRDYSNTYSAKKSLGGGVLRDLSHELDYLNWLSHGWHSLVAFGGQYSNLKIDSDDLFAIMMQTKRSPLVMIQLNYLDRFTRRELIINTEQKTIKMDLIQQTMQINQDILFIPALPDQEYLAEHQEILNGKYDSLCSLEEGIEVIRIIEAAEDSAIQREWISR